MSVDTDPFGLAPYVGASLDVMEADTLRMRGDKPFVFTNLKNDTGLDAVIDFIVEQGMLEASLSLPASPVPGLRSVSIPAGMAATS